jgi:hypothetical protein
VLCHAQQRLPEMILVPQDALALLTQSGRHLTLKHYKQKSIYSFDLTTLQLLRNNIRKDTSKGVFFTLST